MSNPATDQYVIFFINKQGTIEQVRTYSQTIVLLPEQLNYISSLFYNKHVYYHCTRSIDYDCDEPYITEADLIQQLIAYLDDIKINELELAHRLKNNIDQFHKLRSDVLKQEYLNGNLQEIDYMAFNKVNKDMVKRYLLHTLQFGSTEERQEILTVIKTKFVLHNRRLLMKFAHVPNEHILKN